ncbi:MAG: hypothetical protein OHK0028_03490 [Deltaproteobacteria bacterium]
MGTGKDREIRGEPHLARRVPAHEDRSLDEFLDPPLHRTGEVDELHGYDRWTFHIVDALNMPYGTVGVNRERFLRARLGLGRRGRIGYKEKV